MNPSFSTLIKEIKACRSCRNLFSFEPHPIVYGNQDCKIMQISQAPSIQAQKASLPFSDASGRKLRHLWYQIPDEVFYNPKNFYISAISHCYPGKNPNGNDNKPPRICADKWLIQEVKLVNSRLIVLIGRYAADYFFPNIDFHELVFNDQNINGKPVIVLPHPSPLNQKWLKDYPDFERIRLPQIRRLIHQVLHYNE